MGWWKIIYKNSSPGCCLHYVCEVICFCYLYSLLRNPISSAAAAGGDAVRIESTDGTVPLCRYCWWVPGSFRFDVGHVWHSTGCVYVHFAMALIMHTQRMYNMKKVKMERTKMRLDSKRILHKKKSRVGYLYKWVYIVSAEWIPCAWERLGRRRMSYQTA